MPPSTTLLRLIVIDDNPSFRAGLRIWLESFADIEIVAEGYLAQAEALVEEHFAEWLAGTSETPQPDSQEGSLLVLCLPAQAKESATPMFRLCRQVRDRAPALPVLMLGVSAEPVLVAAAKKSGATGFWLRSGNPDALLATIRRVATGQEVWIGVSAGYFGGTGVPGPLAGWRRSVRESGMGRMEQAIAQFVDQLQYTNLSPTERLILEGRLREVRAARWLVARLLATPALPDREPPSAPQPVTPASVSPPAAPLVRRSEPEPSLEPVPPGVAIEPLETSVSARSLRTLLFDTIANKLQGSVQNLTERPLETDILRADRRQELLGLMVRKVEDLLDDLRLSDVTPERVSEKRSQLLLDLWQAGITDFFGKYYTLSTPAGELALVDELLTEAEAVQVEILDPIPYFDDLLCHLLFQNPLIIDGVPYAAGNPEAVLRTELLLSHLVVQLSNAVMQPLLNRFSDLEIIKQNFYDRRLMSTREVERFRNDLSWHYRVARYFSDPRDVFESQYRLFSFQARGLVRQSIYAPRRDELEQLRGVPLAVTLALETRDAIAPRLRSTISVVGSSLVYVLTEVLGRGIGLIGRGIIKGVGNVWQETRYPRNGQRQR